MSDPTPAEEAAAADAMLDAQIADHMQEKEDERRGIYPDHLRDNDEPPDNEREMTMPPTEKKTPTTAHTDDTAPKRNWSNATLLARLADVLADHLGVVGATRENIVRSPSENIPDDMTAVEVIEMLKDRVIVDTMADRA